MAIAYIGLGSNLEQPINQVNQAFIELDQLPESYLLAHSSLYQSSPMTLPETKKNIEQVPTQENYINAVAKLATALPPLELLKKLQAIENEHDRVRGERWGSRTLDLDILLYGHTIIETAVLTIPHAGMKQRDFVLVPLAEISPELALPDNSSILNLITQCEQYDLQRVRETIINRK